MPRRLAATDKEKASLFKKVAIVGVSLLCHSERRWQSCAAPRPSAKNLGRGNRSPKEHDDDA